MTETNVDTTGAVKQLLDDAHLVIDYAVRVGRLPDERLPKAVDAVESATTPESVAQHVPALADAFNKAIVAIAPMTLIDLRGGRNIFDPRNRRYICTLQATFSVLTIALTLVVAIVTEDLHRQDTTLKALQQIQETHPLDKLNALRKMAQFDAALDKQDSMYDQYHHGLSELRDLQDKVTSTYTLVLQAKQSWLQKMLEDSLQDSAQGYSLQEKSALQKQVAVTSNSADSTTHVFDECDSRSQDSRPNVKNYPPWLKQAITDYMEELCFTKNLSLLMSLPSTSTSYQLQAYMAALNGWILPFLYGLLGAMVFVMRNLLDPRTPIMSLFPSLVRVALGGIAGILIGWFWVPSTFKASDIVTISSIPFGLAFLAGFSIDILFSLLDRLSRTVNEPAALKTTQ
jgi:hypothetical protein